MQKSVAILSASLLLAGFLGSAQSNDKAEKKTDKKAPPALNFKMKKIDGKEADLSEYKGKVVLMVNVASKCGYTPQYKGLQELHEKYADKGLVILGFPCNEFGKQEPGTNAEIAKFCDDTYSVKFPLFEKIVVNGEGQAPLYKYLTSKDTDPKFAGPIKWNFEKFLINRKGEVSGRFASAVAPESDEFTEVIEAELEKK